MYLPCGEFGLLDHYMTKPLPGILDLLQQQRIGALNLPASVESA